jgi:hypothetical protein
MAIVVVGGHSRSVGKTSVVASLIARLPERHWTACKITQFGHGFCSANGEPCDCQTDEHTLAITAERDPDTGTDSARFLAAGAVRSLWVRTRIGRLADAMPRIRREIDAAENIIFESNSLLSISRSWTMPQPTSKTPQGSFWTVPTQCSCAHLARNSHRNGKMFRCA